MFSEIFSTSVSTITIGGFLVSVGSAIVLGLIMAWVYMIDEMYSKTFVKTVAMIPAMVAVVIMMVNGSLGASVAVAGTFSLVRFRSAPGTAKEIATIFLAMAVGLACGMGYALFAAIFCIIMCLLDVVYSKLGIFKPRLGSLKKTLIITIPEDLEYETVFKDLMEKYTSEYEMTRFKTTNLGSLDKLTFDVTLRKVGTEKAFVDELRERNGNLEISVLSQAMPVNEL